MELTKTELNSIRVLALSELNEPHPAYHLVEFSNRDGRRAQHLIETRLLHKAGQLREHLSNLGFAGTLDNAVWKRNLASLLAASPPERVTVADRPGWVGHSYLCASGKVIGAAARHGPFLSPRTNITLPQEQFCGKLEGWQTEVAPFALFSSRLMLAVCASFSGFICRLLKMESGGFHFHGSSSIGKSSCLLFAASVFGDRKFIESWAITAKASEEVMASRNDSLLIMDELAALGEDPRRASQEAQKFVYKLAEGQGKRRTAGFQASPDRWCTVLLSAGEYSLQEHAVVGNYARMEGETVRLVDVPADAGQGFGIFEQIGDGVNTSEEFIRRLRVACQENHGRPKTAFLKRLVKSLKKDERLIQRRIQEQIDYFVKSHVPPRSPGITHRMASRFALAYAAGVVGVNYSILPYTEEEIYEGVSACYEAALESAPKTLDEKVIAAQELIRVELAEASPLDLMAEYSPRDLDRATCVLKTVGEDRIIGLKRKRLEKLVPDRNVQDKLLSLFESEGWLLGTDTRPIQVKPEGGKGSSRRYYCFRSPKKK